MDLLEVVDQVQVLLQRRGRITYRLLKAQFQLDDEALEALKEELIEGQEVAADKDGKMLVWTGGETSLESASPPVSESLGVMPSPAPLSPSSPPVSPISPQLEAPQADRRQLTVMFCDLVGSTPMSAQLDPEDYRDIMQAYQEMCGQVLARFTGYIARYEGDGILVYFGYPQAQEDAAAQAVRAGLQIIEGLPDLNARFQPRFPLLQERPLQVRIGMHTGLVVVGEMGSEQYRIDIAVGETPNMAARIQGQAGPNEVIISAATYKLVEGLFACKDLGPRELKGIDTPQSVYLVTAESAAHSRFEVAVQKGLTPLVGREEESGLLCRRWERAQAGTGQVVLLSGEPGIGKSRLVQDLKESTAAQSPVNVECHCSPNTQNSALAPVIGHLQRLLQFERNESPDSKIQKLEQTLTTYHFSLPDTIPLLASLLSLPVPETYPPLQLTPQKQKEKTLELLVIWLRNDAERQPLRVIFEDLHWADPSTLEFLTLLVDQVATMRALLILTFRPEFTPPWPSRPHVLALHLDRLREAQIAELAQHVAGKALPAEVMQQLIAKTDGIPLFAEELTKTVLESGHLQATEGRYELTSPLQEATIPTTLQDSLRARLDRLNTAREIAQIGAIIGREFSYELVRAVSSLEEAALQSGLRQLADADLVSQKGIPPQAQYVFKHALIQDSAYQSILRSTRQQYHKQIAQVLEQQFVETKDTQPELLAHHYTEAGLMEQAISYWQHAGERAAQRSATTEAESHLTTGIRLLKTTPDTPERAQQELSLQLALGPVQITTKSIGHADVEITYTRSHELCQQLGDTPQLFPTLWGLRRFYILRAAFKTARELEEQLLRLAQDAGDPAMVSAVQWAWGTTSFWTGELTIARERYAHSLSLYRPDLHHSQVAQYGTDLGVAAHSYHALTLWHLGYPDQALEESRKSLTLAHDVAHPFSQAFALSVSAWLYYLRREVHVAQEEIEASIRLATKYEIPFWVAWGGILRGWALALQGQGAEGIPLLRQSKAAHRALGGVLAETKFLAKLADAYRATDQPEDGLQTLTQALEIGDKRGERAYIAELYVLKGELLLNAERGMMGTINDERQTGEASALPQAAEAEECFQKALDVARQQEAKSWELRAATSLARLWQQQGKTVEARALLAPVYHWFTEGFDTHDLKEAKALLTELAQGV